MPQVRDTNLDRLEQLLDVLAHGDVQPGAAAVPAGAAGKLLRVAQLAVEYLLHVQASLSCSNAALEAQVEARDAELQGLRAALALQQGSAHVAGRDLGHLAPLAASPSTPARVGTAGALQLDGAAIDEELEHLRRVVRQALGVNWDGSPAPAPALGPLG